MPDICTLCDEEWEDDFFCEKCSQPEFDAIFVDNERVEGWFPVRACLNCCTCSIPKYSLSMPSAIELIPLNDDIPF